jgi:hypothetical protein
MDSAVLFFAREVSVIMEWDEDPVNEESENPEGNGSAARPRQGQAEGHSATNAPTGLSAAFAAAVAAIAPAEEEHLSPRPLLGTDADGFQQQAEAEDVVAGPASSGYRPGRRLSSASAGEHGSEQQPQQQAQRRASSQPRLQLSKRQQVQVLLLWKTAALGEGVSSLLSRALALAAAAVLISGGESIGERAVLVGNCLLVASVVCAMWATLALIVSNTLRYRYVTPGRGWPRWHTAAASLQACAVIVALAAGISTLTSWREHNDSAKANTLITLQQRVWQLWCFCMCLQWFAAVARTCGVCGDLARPPRSAIDRSAVGPSYMLAWMHAGDAVVEVTAHTLMASAAMLPLVVGAAAEKWQPGPVPVPPSEGAAAVSLLPQAMQPVLLFADCLWLTGVVFCLVTSIVRIVAALEHIAPPTQ